MTNPIECIDKQKPYYSDEQLAKLKKQIQTVPVDDDGLTIPVEYDERYVRGTVLKLIADIHSAQEEMAKLEDKAEKDVRWALVRMEEARNDIIRLKARATQAERERDALLETMKRIVRNIGNGDYGTAKDAARSTIAKIEGGNPQ